MKIGIDARLVDDKSSGLVGYTKNLISQLSKGNKLTLFCRKKYASEIKALLEGDSHKIVNAEYSAFLSISNFLYERFIFGKIVNSFDIDLFHSPFGFGVPAGISTKSVLTVHDVIPLTGHDKLSFLKNTIYKYSLSSSIKRADGVIFISEFTKDELEKRYSLGKSKKNIVVHNGFDKLSSFKGLQGIFDKVSEREGLRSIDYISYVGSATPRKNLKNLVQGFLDYRRNTNSKTKLFLVSKFNRKVTLKTKNELVRLANNYNEKDAIIFPSCYISDIEKASIIKNSNFFVYPSLYEGFGLPILEAMSLGKAIACSNIDVFEELYGDGVATFNPRKVDSIHEVLKMLNEDSSKRSMYEKKAHNFVIKFSWEGMAKKYMSFYRQVV